MSAPIDMACREKRKFAEQTEESSRLNHFSIQARRMGYAEAHTLLACKYSLKWVENNTKVWKAMLNKSTVEDHMESICLALKAECSSDIDTHEEKLRFIRDSMAYDSELNGCKIGDSLWYEILSMAVFWVALLFLQIVQLLVSRYRESRNAHNGPRLEPSTFSRRIGRIRVACERLATPWSWPGKILGVIWSLCSVVSFAFYLHQTHSHYRFIRFCQNQVDRIYAYIDLGFNIFFFLYFVVRYIASVNKASFLFAPHSLMEVCTIGPSISTVINSDKHSLFNFLRAIRLAAIKEVLISFNLLSAATSKSLFSLIIDMFCFWSTLAGLIHLLENQDNFWWGLGPKAFNPCKAVNFFNSFYMLIITASTVGYGDFYPRTTLGQLTVMICIVVAGTYFLTTVPAMISIYLENRLNQKFKFHTGIGQRHIVLTGAVEYINVRAFLTEFYLDDHLTARDWTTQAKCCVLHTHTLPASTQWLLYGLTGRVRAIRGSCANPRDLMDVKAFSANAVIILARMLPPDKNEDDSDNYMRAMTVKLNFPDVRTIVQIHSFYNKFSYYCLRGWRSKSQRNSQWDLDTVICMDYISNGLLGLNCAAPGFASLVLNLLVSCEPAKTDLFKQYKWRTFYNFGRQASFRCAKFTRSFRGLTFKAACAVVYDRWGIILLGVSVDQANSHSCTNIINPSSDSSFFINPSIMKAFVVCKDMKDLQRFESYCNYCKNRADGVCNCDGPSSSDMVHKAEAMQRSVAEKLLREKQMRKNALFTNKNCEDAAKSAMEANNSSKGSKGGQSEAENKDETVQIAECKWEDMALMPDSPRDLELEEEFRRAVELGGGGDSSDDSDVNKDTAAPLDPFATWRYERAFRPVADISRTLHWAPKRPCRLLDIEEANDVPWTGHVLVCVLGRVDSPVGLSALLLPLRSHLIDPDELRDFVVLGDADGLAKHEWKHVISFRQVYFVRGSGLFTNHLVCCRVHDASAAVVMQVGAPPARPDGEQDAADEAGCSDSGGGDVRGHEAFGLADTDVVVCAENVRAVVIGRRGVQHYRESFHLTVRLNSPSVASFFSDLKEREKDMQRLDVTATQAFAEGLVISDTQLATLVSATFHCPEVAQFLQALIQGSNQMAVDNFLGSYIGIPSEFDTDRVGLLSPSYPFRICQLSIRDMPLSTMFDSFNSSTIYWEELYIRSLEKFGIICLGLYQLRRKNRLVVKEKKPSGRFVYTFPSRRTIVDASDKIFCIVPGLSRGGGGSGADSDGGGSGGGPTQSFLTKKIEQKVIKTGEGIKSENKKLNAKYFDMKTAKAETSSNSCDSCLDADDLANRNFNFNFISPSDTETAALDN